MATNNSTRDAILAPPWEFSPQKVRAIAEQIADLPNRVMTISAMGPERLDYWQCCNTGRDLLIGAMQAGAFAGDKWHVFRVAFANNPNLMTAREYFARNPAELPFVLGDIDCATAKKSLQGLCEPVAKLLLNEAKQMEKPSAGGKPVGKARMSQTKIAKAIGLLGTGMKVKDIAHKVNCHPKTLSNSKRFKDARAALKAAKLDLMRGSKDNASGRMEAWDDDDKRMRPKK